MKSSVLFISLYPMNCLGGGETYILNALASALNDGIECTLAFPLSQLPDRSNSSERRERKYGVKISRSQNQPLAIYSWQEILFLLSEFDVVWVHQYLSNDCIFDIITAIPSYKKLLFTSHGHETISREFNHFYQQSSHHHFIEVSNYAASRLTCVRKNLRHIGGGVWLDNIIQPVQRAATNKLEICAIGRLLPHKGYEHTLKAARHDDTLTIAGPIGFNTLYQNYLNQQSSLAVVKYLGEVDDVQLVSILKSSDVLVASSCHGLYNGDRVDQPELLGLVLLEALAVGIMIITSDIPAFAEVMSNLGLEDYIYQEGRSDDLKCLLDKFSLLTAKERYELVSSAQIILTKKYLWNDYWSRVQLSINE